MVAKPPHLAPLNVFGDIARIAQGEVLIKNRLTAARARINQFNVDLRAYERKRPVRAMSLKKQLRRKLKAASTQWLGTEETKAFREALAWLNAQTERPSDPTPAIRDTQRWN